MFDAPPSVALPGGTPRFGDPNSVWPSEPSEGECRDLSGCMVYADAASTVALLRRHRC